LSKKLLTASEVAEMLQIGEDGLRRWRYRGEGPKAIKLGYRTLRYRQEDVEAWLAANETETPGQKRGNDNDSP
jgi:predicted DNA-binding transcriptional regulator AlpA